MGISHHGGGLMQNPHHGSCWGVFLGVVFGVVFGCVLGGTCWGMVYGWPSKVLGLLGLSCHNKRLAGRVLSNTNGSPAESCHNKRLAGRVLSQTARRPDPVRGSKTKKNKKNIITGKQFNRNKVLNLMVVFIKCD